MDLTSFGIWQINISVWITHSINETRILNISRLIWRSERFEQQSHMCAKLKNIDKFENIGHSDPVISVSLALVSMHICVKYEGSLINHIGGWSNCWKNGKWLPLKNVGSIDLTVYTLRTEPHSPIRVSKCKNWFTQIKFNLPRFTAYFKTYLYVAVTCNILMFCQHFYLLRWNVHLFINHTLQKIEKKIFSDGCSC